MKSVPTLSLADLSCTVGPLSSAWGWDGPQNCLGQKEGARPHVPPLPPLPVTEHQKPQERVWPCLKQLFSPEALLTEARDAQQCAG